MSDNPEHGELAPIARIAHDFRQPLQALALLQAALDLSALDAANRQIVKDMGRAVDSMTEMVDTLTVAAKLDAGTISPNMASVPLAGLMDPIAAGFREQARGNGVEIRVVPSTACIRSDGELLWRIVHALVSNAVAFTESGRVLLGVRRRGATYRIEVWDTGVGIPAEQEARIFERFFSDDRTLHGRTPHIGLGLSVARELASLLGHGLTLRSWPGRGSVFALSGDAATAPEIVALDRAAGQVREGRLAGRDVVLGGDPAYVGPVEALFARWRTRVIRVDARDSLADALREASPRNCLVVLAAQGESDLAGLYNAARCVGPKVPVIVIADEAAARAAGQLGVPEERIVRSPVNPGRLRALAEHLVTRSTERN